MAHQPAPLLSVLALHASPHTCTCSPLCASFLHTTGARVPYNPRVATLCGAHGVARVRGVRGVAHQHTSTPRTPYAVHSTYTPW